MERPRSSPIDYQILGCVLAAALGCSSPAPAPDHEAADQPQLAGPASAKAATSSGGAAGNGGPQPLSIRCVSPAPDAVVEVAPGTTVMLSGLATGATALAVDGVATPIAADGTFTLPITSRYGVNHVEVRATDAAGTLRRALCSFLVADHFVDEGMPLADAGLRLGPVAIDDGDRTGPVNSLADILTATLDSAALAANLHASFLNANPLATSPMTVDYVSSSLPGPSTVRAAQVDGGLEIHVRFEDPQVRLHAAAGFLSSDGDVDVDYIDIDAVLDLSLGVGRPQVRVRPGSTAIAIGRIDTNFGGFFGDLIDVLVSVANSFVKNTLATQLAGAVTDRFNIQLAALLTRLEISGPQAAFAVSRFDCSGSTMITFDAGVSALDVSATGMLVGVSTRFSAPAAHDRQPMRAPLPPGAVRLDADAAQPAALAEHVGLLQQALQANWRGGGLDGSVTTASGARVAFVTTLPPVVFFEADGSVGIDLGVDANVTLPGATAPVHARAAVRAHASATLADDDLLFSAVTLEESHVSPDAELNAADTSTLNDTLTALLAQMAQQSLDDALPRLPIPAFTIPESFAVYGLPAGQKLGLVGAALTLGANHAVLRGGFGLR